MDQVGILRGRQHGKQGSAGGVIDGLPRGKGRFQFGQAHFPNCREARLRLSPDAGDAVLQVQPLSGGFRRFRGQVPKILPDDILRHGGAFR